MGAAQKREPTLRRVVGKKVERHICPERANSRELVGICWRSKVTVALSVQRSIFRQQYSSNWSKREG